MREHHKQAGRYSKVKNPRQVRGQHWRKKDWEPNDTDEERDEELPTDQTVIPTEGGDRGDQEEFAETEYEFVDTVWGEEEMMGFGVGSNYGNE